MAKIMMNNKLCDLPEPGQTGALTSLSDDYSPMDYPGFNINLFVYDRERRLLLQQFQSLYRRIICK